MDTFETGVTQFVIAGLLLYLGAAWAYDRYLLASFITLHAALVLALLAGINAAAVLHH